MKSQTGLIVATLVSAGVAITAPNAAHACVQTLGGPPCEVAPATFVIADVGLHVVNVGLARSVDRAQQLVVQVSAGLYGPWTQTGNVFGVSGDAIDIDVIGAVIRARLVWYPASKLRGIWLSTFGQAGAANILDQTAQPDGAHVGLVASVGASVGYAWWLGSAHHWHVALGAGGQFHVAAGDPGFAQPYPHIDAIVGYRW